MLGRQFISSLLLTVVVLIFSLRLQATTFDTSICKGASINLSSSVKNASKYWWNTGDSVLSIKVTPLQNTKYISFAVVNKDTLRDTINVNVLEYPNKPLIDFKDSSIVVSNPLKLSVRWLRNNIELNATKDTLKYPSEGVYKIKMGIKELCWTYSDPIYLTKDYDSSKPSFELLTYPNPSTGSFNIYITIGKRISQEIKIKVLSVSGTELVVKNFFVYQSNNIKIPVALPLGIKEQVVVSCFINNKWITKQHVVN